MKFVLVILFFTQTALKVCGDQEVEDNECKNENEEMGCLMPAPCWKTCENMDNYVQCGAPCMPGCDCIPGFVRDKNGYCIDPKDCPKHDCPPHQEIGCESPCFPNICENSYYNGPRRICDAMCIRQCVCEEGWTFKSNEDRYCIPIEGCPICCAGNREFKECGPYNPRSCYDPYAAEEICGENCNKGCFCKDNLVEDEIGNCIPPENCPLHCGANEIEDDCVNPCQPTCDYPDPPVCQCLVCNKGCVCRPPYIRDNITIHCVDRNNCSKTSQG